MDDRPEARVVAGIHGEFDINKRICTKHPGRLMSWGEVGYFCRSCISSKYGIRDVINTQYDLIQLFSTPDKPVNVDEFLKFWDSLSPEDIQYFTFVRLS